MVDLKDFETVGLLRYDEGLHMEELHLNGLYDVSPYKGKSELLIRRDIDTNQLYLRVWTVHENGIVTTTLTDDQTLTLLTTGNLSFTATSCNEDIKGDLQLVGPVEIRGNITKRIRQRFL